jgi:multidrug transporter EmrE-like cation transporter
MAHTKPWAIALVIISTLLNATAQIFYKIGASNLTPNLSSIITNYPLLLGLLIYGISACLLIVSLKYGELSVLYPIVATGYIWVTLASAYFFNEQLNNFKIAAILTIIIGIFFIGLGSKEKESHIRVIA